MIERVYFDRLDGSRGVWPFEDYGILLKSYSASPPDAKTYRVELDGMDGSLDLSEWAGDVKFADRAVQIGLRDMQRTSERLVQALGGRRWRIWFSDDENHYYEGRCEQIEKETRRRVTDLTLNFACSPWRMAREERIITQSIGTGATLTLMAARKPVIPTLTTTAACTVVWNGESHSLSAGTINPAWLVVTDTPKVLSVTGSGTITVSWRDGVL